MSRCCYAFLRFPRLDNNRRYRSNVLFAENYVNNKKSECLSKQVSQGQIIATYHRRAVLLTSFSMETNSEKTYAQWNEMLILVSPHYCVSSKKIAFPAHEIKTTKIPMPYRRSNLLSRPNLFFNRLFPIAQYVRNEESRCEYTCTEKHTERTKQIVHACRMRAVHKQPRTCRCTLLYLLYEKCVQSHTRLCTSQNQKSNRQHVIVCKW